MNINMFFKNTPNKYVSNVVHHFSNIQFLLLLYWNFFYKNNRFRALIINVNYAFILLFLFLLY